MSPAVQITQLEAQRTVLPALRRELGLTQVQLARWFGVTEGTIIRWEGGQMQAPQLHMRIADLIRRADDPSALMELLAP